MDLLSYPCSLQSCAEDEEEEEEEGKEKTFEVSASSCVASLLLCLYPDLTGRVISSQSRRLIGSIILLFTPSYQ